MFNQETNQLFKNCITLFIKRPLLFIFPSIACVIGYAFLIALGYIFHLQGGLIELLQPTADTASPSNQSLHIDPLSSRLWLIIPLVAIITILHGMLLRAFCLSIKKAFNHEPLNILQTALTTVRNISPITKDTIYYYTKGYSHPRANHISKYFSSVFFRLHGNTRGYSSSSADTFDHCLTILNSIQLERLQKLQKAFQSFLVMLFIGATTIGTAVALSSPSSALALGLSIGAMALIATIFSLSILRSYSVALYIYMTEGAIPSADFTELFDQP